MQGIGHAMMNQYPLPSHHQSIAIATANYIRVGSKCKMLTVTTFIHHQESGTRILLFRIMYI